MKCMISQPRYLPSLNYLQRIYQVDTFVILDDVQHHKQCFEHRNKILMNDKPIWISIPIDRTSTSRPIIKDMHAIGNWVEEHAHLLEQGYKKHNFFDPSVYLSLHIEAKTNSHFVSFIKDSLERTFDFLELKKPNIVLSSALNIQSGGSKKLADICHALEASSYISGPNGKDYLVKEDFQNCKIYFDHYTFPQYHQKNKEFVSWLTWLDALFNEGRDFVIKQVTNPLSLEAVNTNKGEKIND